VSRFTLSNALRHAIERDEFQIYYQPIVQFGNGRIIGVEALLRWHHPTQGIVPPLEFIAVLEESGLIIQVGKWVLATACLQGEAWRRRGFGDIKVNVNISAKQFSDSNLLQYVDEALKISRFPAHLLNLEITESLLIDNKDRVLQVLDDLNDKGVSMSIDDFGTGYSSMAYLKNMPIEIIKIDKSFVHGIPYDLDDVAIVHAIDYLSKNLRLDVIAEGVETEAQMNFLKKLNVFAIQGYLISRPVPVVELEDLLRRHDAARFKA
jgi:EAL domain-containing protein (putative c-di-GMP-specific phosphodiesterase class I)